MYLPRLVFDITFQSEYLREEPFYYISFGIILSFFCALPLYNTAPIDEEKMERLVYITTLIICALGFSYALSYEYLFIARANANSKLNEGTFTTVAVIPLALATKYLVLKGPPLKKFLAIFAFFLALACVLMSGTKAPMGFYGIFLLLFLRKQMRFSPIKTIILILTIIGIIAYIVYIYDLGFAFELILRRFTKPTSGDKSTAMRLLAWKGALNQFLDSPIWGSAIEERVTRQYPHNLILESFMAVGTVGGVLFTFMYLRLAIVVFFNFVKSNFSIVPMLCLLYFVLSLFSGSLYGGTGFWAVVALSSVYKKQLHQRFAFESAKSSS